MSHSYLHSTSVYFENDSTRDRPDPEARPSSCHVRPLHKRGQDAPTGFAVKEVPVMADLVSSQSRHKTAGSLVAAGRKHGSPAGVARTCIPVQGRKYTLRPVDQVAPGRLDLGMGEGAGQIHSSRETRLQEHAVSLSFSRLSSDRQTRGQVG